MATKAGGGQRVMGIYQYLALCMAILLLVACSPMTTAEPAINATATQAPVSTATPPAIVSPTAQPTTRPTNIAATPTATTQPTSVPTTPTTTTQPTPQATLTNTRTPQSTATFLPPTTRPTQIPTAQACIAYTDAAQFVGQTRCVTGSISSTSQSGSTYFINFSASRDSFYAVSFNLNQASLPLTKGQCVKLNGKIETFNSRTQMVIRDASQVAPC